MRRGERERVLSALIVVNKTEVKAYRLQKGTVGCINIHFLKEIKKEREKISEREKESQCVNG